jgi:predicted kinase
VLLVINGAPAVGKSTLARRYADDHALTLVVDVDSLRTHLGGWQEHDESKHVARGLAVALTRAHLAAGHDVIVPQYIGRPEFLARLRATADEAGVAFVEIVLTDDVARIAERFRARRAEYAARGEPHPELDVADDAIDDLVADARAGLLRDASTRGAMVVDASGGTEPAYRALLGKVVR